MYNKPGICLAVDELDAGIFEYLLGEILEIIQDRAKGQLVFTSHNLRPLEKLNKESLIFTTTNPQNRYIRFTNVKETNNLRSFYYRAINLGGQADRDKTFYSVILSGVHDVKNLKLKLRDDEEHKYNSTWNIASEFKVDFELEVDQIASMLNEYQEDRTIDLDLDYFAEKMHYYTSGHPFLVSKLAEIIAEEILRENESSWNQEYLEQAVKIILAKDLPNFETLIKNIENNNDLEDICIDLIVDGRKITYNLDNPTIEKGELYGIFKNDNGSLKIHNRIYEQRIYNYLISKIENSMESDAFDFKDSFIDNGQLNLKAVLERFQVFIKEQYSDRDRDFLERNGRLIFLAFLKPIINGKGFDFKEVQISQEKRIDVVITYLEQKYIVELKIWRGEEYHQRGLEQLADYLESQNMDQGYLLSFNFNLNKEYKNEEMEVKNKKIFAYWV
ncbi:GxxExxY protein [Halanaerobium sp.]|uniref:GxxExxY protein n=1 Tax=Halanaerobium sp. TaxID=1895664 RepID=UPI0025C33D75|nr:GxxExxY protein [Halanaerobium sp.]